MKKKEKEKKREKKKEEGEGEGRGGEEEEEEEGEGKMVPASRCPRMICVFQVVFSISVPCLGRSSLSSSNDPRGDQSFLTISSTHSPYAAPRLPRYKLTYVQEMLSPPVKTAFGLEVPPYRRFI